MALTLLFAAVSGGLTVLLWVGGMAPWWILPVWVGLYVAVALACIITVVLMLYLFLPKCADSPRRLHFAQRIAKAIVDWVLVMLGMRVKAIGTDRLPATPYLWVCNHRSAFDPLCTLPQVTTPMVFVCKPGVLRIPVIGSVMERLNFLAIDRENARNAVTTIKRSAELIKDVGLCVGIYPEGTRCKTDDILPFHAGSFKIAKIANCPVAVATIRYEKWGLLPWNKRVHLQVVDVMDAAYVAESNTAAMTERAEAAIRQDLGL